MLPIYADPEDMDEVISYLRTKATGASLEEARATIEERLLDRRKLSGYEKWGFIDSDDDTLKLTKRGRRYARVSEERRSEFYRGVIGEIRAYRLAAEWIFHSGFEEVPTVELAAHWHEHVPDELGTDSENTIRDQVTCFFKVGEAANIGEYVVGRGGKKSRFVVNQDELGQFIAELGLEGDSETKQEEISGKKEDEDKIDEADEEDEVAPSDVADEVLGNGQESIDAPEESLGTEQRAVPTTGATPDSEPESLKVFISHGKNMEVVEQIKTMLDLADLEFEVAVEEQTTAIPVPDKVLDAMRRCNAAVICVTADGKGEEDNYKINKNVLIEIGAAFVLYEKKVVLVWDSRLDVPSNLQGLYRCEFEGDELSWSAGMRLMKAVNKFKE